MRNLFILRGVPACGKSTWIEENGYKHYTLSSDDLRLLFQCPEYNVEGYKTISSSMDKQVWKFLFELLENKMKAGETVFVDATHCNNKSLKPYKELVEKYKYRAYIVDFMCDKDNNIIDKQVFIDRNHKREWLKVVPDSVIDRMYESYCNCEAPSSRFKVIKPNDVHEILYDVCYDFNKWNEIVIFGDIHGCVEPLQEWFNKHAFTNDTFYIFVGDYIDRGLQNAETLTFLNNLLEKAKENNNVLLLTGNHEAHIIKYLETGKGNSQEFNENTIPQLETLDKSIIKNIVNRLSQMAYFIYNGKTYFVSHGGMPKLPDGLTKTSELIKGVGNYEDTVKMYNTWKESYSDDVVLIHGHRNIQMLPTKVANNIYNINDEIEWGGNLRILQINKDTEEPIIHLIKNNTYKERSVLATTRSPYATDNEFIQQLNNSKFVNKKVLRNGIVSYNFTRDAFLDSKWNDLTITARGLFIDTQTDKIVARSYNKFFAINERPETQLNTLESTLNFPVTAYKKENGFLGLISYDKRNHELFIASKSTNEGPFAGYLREQWELLPVKTRSSLTNFLEQNDCTLIFEVINQDTDPHIIRYKQNGLYLLDVVENSFDFKRMSYDDLVMFAEKYGLNVKKKEYVIKDFDSFKEFYKNVEADTQGSLILHEGWVFEDTKGFMIKYKTQHYRFWKWMRSLKDKITKEKQIPENQLNDKAKKVVDFMKSMNIEKLKTLSIIDIKELYYAKLDKNEN